MVLYSGTEWKETWMEPYLNSNIGVYMISYVIPIEVDGESIGIIGMDIDFSEFTDTIDSLSIFDSGYGFLVNESGKVMYHKDLEIGSNLADADSGLQSVVDALGNEQTEETAVSYTYQGKIRSCIIRHWKWHEICPYGTKN